MTHERVRHETGMLRHQAHLTHRAVRMNVEGLTHEDSLLQPQPGGNCHAGQTGVLRRLVGEAGAIR